MLTNLPITQPILNLVEHELLIPARLVALDAPVSIAHALTTHSLLQRTLRNESIGLVVGDNHFDAYAIARAAIHQQMNPGNVLERIELSRAFTCHQLHRRILTLDDKRLKRWHALCIAGLLDTFYDESVSFDEAARLLQELLARLKHIASGGLPVLITLSPSKQLARMSLAKMIAQNVDAYWRIDRDTPTQPTSAHSQMALVL
jgi:nucleotidyltransferase/DNA polymerase involved in DNA repair